MSDERKTCRCGYAIGDGMIAEEPRYSLGGTLALLFGITARPVELVFECRKCGEVLARTSDPAKLRAHHT
ncbi:MAG: hypothetical protein ACQEXJ_02415 [Myxococcota bacterium]